MSGTERSECMRLGFISARAGHLDGGLWADAGLGRLIKALRSRASKFTCALVHAPERRMVFDQRFELDAGEFIPLPPLPGFIRGFHKIRACRAAVREVEQRSDVVVVQMPFIAPLALRGAQTPRVYHVFGDVLGMARASSEYQGFQRPAAVAAAYGIDWVQRRLFHRPQTHVVTHGEAMLRRYGIKQGRAVVSSTFYREEIGSVKRERPSSAPFRVLFAGYLRPEKGIDTLLEAFRQMLDQVPDAELYIVGPTVPEKGKVVEELLLALEALQQRATVHFMGHQPFGPALFRCFADADVLALPSRTEGTPRVLVEARAFGCPVVATRVGGVPFSVENGVDGLLVPPNDPGALCSALVRIACDATLRQRLIAGGVKRAERTTLEDFASALFEEAEHLFREHTLLTAD